MKIYYLGPKGSFSEQAARAFAVNIRPSEVFPKPSFPEIFSATEHEDGSFAVLPVENSITSSVHETTDLLFHSHLYIVAEYYLPIRLFLYLRSEDPSTEIQSLASHPKAFEQLQCLFRDYSELPRRECLSSSQAAELVLQEPRDGFGFIGSDAFLGDSRLRVLPFPSQKNIDNCTRFLLCSQELLEKNSIQDPKVSALFRTRHTSGALLHVLEALAKAGVNITRLESRPIPDTRLEYFFWIDYEVDAKNLETSLESLRKTCLEFRLRGVYERAEWPEPRVNKE